MSRVLAGFLVLLLLILGSGFVVMGSWDMPAPKQTVEKALPDERFPR